MTCKICDERPAANGSFVCNTCRSRKWRKANPIRSAWHNLKNSARKRKYEFNLPYENFHAFAVSSGYDKNRGRTAQCLVIDRIKNDMGYTMDNIQVITKSNNSKKYWDEVRDKNYQEWVEKECPF